MNVRIPAGRAAGHVTAPPSKSMAHRMLIAAALAAGESRITGVDPSEDVSATMDCLRALGAQITLSGDVATVRGVAGRPRAAAPLPCRECGTTLRLMIPLSLIGGGATLTGSKQLLSRPLAPYRAALTARGVEWDAGETSLTVRGHLTAGQYELPGDVSSQFVSGLLFALPLLPTESRIVLSGTTESRSYIELTRSALADAGVVTKWEGSDTLAVPGGARWMPRDAAVEGDWSNAAPWLALAALGDAVTVSGLRQDSLQGDRVSVRYLAALAGGCPTLSVTDCPDLAPVLMATAALSNGCCLTGTRRLAYKESDRGCVMAEELAKCGCPVAVGEDSIRVGAAAIHAPVTAFSSHNDHRIAMALSLILTRTGGILSGAECVRKSDPAYWQRLRKLGVDVKEDGTE